MHTSSSPPSRRRLPSAPRHCSQWLLLLAVCYCLAPVAALATTPDETNTIAVFRAASPSVVTVSSRQYRRSRLFSQSPQSAGGSGSGFIWDRDGYIVTNHHVIHSADMLRVTLEGGESYAAEVVGSAPEQDLAVLRITEPKRRLLSPLPVGDSDRLQVGHKVLAIGHPFGLGHSLSVGVVSALGRELRTSGGRRARGVIQTDAAINPGNSGGPLLNSRGELVGVNSQIYTTTGGSLGIGFAIPVNTVRTVVPQLIAHGYVIRPRLGVELLNDFWRRSLGVQRGVVVAGVVPGSPAAQAGIVGLRSQGDSRPTVGDIILEVDGVEVDNFDDVNTAIEQHKVGDTVNLVLLRGTKRKRLKLRLYNLPPHNLRERR